MTLDASPDIDPNEGTPLHEEIPSSEDALVREDAEEPSRTPAAVVHDPDAVHCVRNETDERAVITATFTPTAG